VIVPWGIARPLLHSFAPESAHCLTLMGLRLGLAGRGEAPDPRLKVRLWNREFASPIGLAAGFDKDGVAVDPLLALGFGFVEIGSVTPRPQPGNPKPRMFRLAEDEAVINRLGFNSSGAAVAARNLSDRKPGRSPGIVGINLGKNKESTDAAADYGMAAEALARHADYLVVNVSSPNTPGLRALQNRTELEAIVIAVDRVRAKLSPKPPLLVKIAPDLSPEAMAEIAEFAKSGACDGLIVSNTTIVRPATLRGRHKNEVGGLSGRPLMEPSTQMLFDMYRLTEARVPIIGVGGVASGADAYAKLRAGASLVALYSALVYQGPGLIARIHHELLALLAREGLSGPLQAVGADHRC
jgi:dihydroorotate dehydrogenase